MNSKEQFFLTGVTGALGGRLLNELLRNFDGTFFVLVRSSKKFSAEERIRKILAAEKHEDLFKKRVFVLEGDVTLPCFGLKGNDFQKLISKTTVFYHVAALTALNGSEEDCRIMNVQGTLEALGLAWKMKKEGSLRRFFYFSTAYVAGSRQTFHSPEDTLPEKPAFANFYESSKYASEQNVREALKQGLPATIFRPSIVVGDSKTGEVSSFNVIYPFMKLFVHGILRIFPTRLENSVNIVPVDFVVKASVEISKQDSSVGKVFHLVTQSPPTIGMMLNYLNKAYPNVSIPQLISPEKFKPEILEGDEKLAYEILEPYLGYLNDHLSFDTRNTEAALKSTSLRFPDTDEDFLKVLFDYAVKTGYLVV